MGLVCYFLYTLVSGDWIMAFSLFVAVAVYFFVHRKGDEEHEVQVFEHGVRVDTKFFPMEKFSGYWFVYGQGVSVLNFQLSGKNDRKISLQMGDKTPDFFRSELQSTELHELPEQKESLIDLWIRALKL